MKAEKPLGKRTTKGVAWSFLREGVTELLVFPLSMLLARVLTPREFGIAAAAGFFTLLAGKLSELGFNAALVRAREVREEHYSTVFVVNLIVGVITFAGLTAGAPLVARFYDTPETGQILPVAALAFLIVPLGTVPAAVLSRDMRWREMTLVDWYFSLSFAVITLALAWSGFSYMSMVYGRVASMTVLTASRLYYSPWRPSLAFSRSALRDVLSFGAGVHAKRMLDFTAQNIDNLLVGRLFGMESLGFYDKAYSTMNRFLVRLNTGGPGVVFRAFAVMQDEHERFRRAYQKVIMSTTLIAFPLFAGLISVAPQFIVVLFGDRWKAAAVPFQLLCLGACFKLLNLYASSASQAVGRVWSEVWRQVLYVGVIVGGLIVFRSSGAVGAAAVVLVATASMTLAMLALLTTVTPVRWSDVVRPLVPALVGAAGVVAVELTIEAGFTRMGHVPSPWVLLGVQVVGAAVFYTAFVLFVPHAGLRTLVHDVIIDLGPPWLKRMKIVRWYISAPENPAVDAACS
jgi:O-antigen/teichoic acid export membrane protein